jgi:hypothetical protein
MVPSLGLLLADAEPADRTLDVCFLVGFAC